MASIGGYDLHEQIGQGASAHVFGGVHRATGTPIAAKLARADVAAHDVAQSELLREFELIASLDHPAVVAVLDGGFLDEPLSIGEARFERGWPYMVEERADGTLRDHEISTWEQARRLLQTLLEGLAYAHARGVVHRDLKPENILQYGAHWRIGDFGLSSSTSAEQSRPNAGSPRFMAPEQFRGAARDLIPATDLYALGGIAYWVVCGRAPFEASTYLDFARLHLEEPPPELVPRFDVPEGLQRWIHRLLSKRQVGRFLRAADAMSAFANLDGPKSWPAARAESGDDFAAVVGCPVPATWRRDLVSRTDALVAASTSLFGLRAPPLVGRDSERDQLWEALLDVHRSGRARIVLLEGGAGCGKSRLARWLCERADEVGAATHMVAYGDRTRGGTGALMDMAARYLRSINVERSATRQRAEELFDVYGIERDWRLDALERLLLECARDGDEIALEGGERTGLLWALFQSVAARPLIVHIDDVHHCEGALELIRSGFADGRPAARVLFVLTVQREALFNEPNARELVNQLDAVDGSSRILLGDLTPSESRTLLRELLRLDEKVLRHLADRMGGNPLYAVQLVADWVASDALTYVDGQLQLDASVRPAVPDSISKVWRERLLHAIGPGQPEARKSLELAAILGREVAHADWLGVCNRIGVHPPEHLITTLVAHGLVHSENRGWAFAHEMLRATILQDCRDAGRWVEFNRAVGLYVETQSSILPAHDRSSRAARHLIEGDDPRAMELLLEAIEQAQVYGDHYFALELVSVAEELTDVDPELQLRCRLASAESYARIGQVEYGFDITRETAKVARQRHLRPVEAEAALTAGWMCRMLGRLHDAATHAEEAQKLFGEIGDENGVARATLELADDYVYMSRHLDAIELYRAARMHFGQHGPARQLAQCEYGIGYAYQQRGQLDAATPYIEEAYELYQKIGAHSDAFGVLLSLGDLARERGELDLAEQRYRSCADYFEATGDGSGTVAYLNLALVELARDDYTAVRGWTEYARQAIEQYRYEALRGGLHALLLVCDAAERDWRAWDKDFAALPKWVHETGVLERDDIVALERAAELAVKVGERSRGGRAYELVAQLWERAKSKSGVDRARAALARL